jgi:hypothetical protein
MPDPEDTSPQAEAVRLCDEKDHLIEVLTATLERWNSVLGLLSSEGVYGDERDEIRDIATTAVAGIDEGLA